MITLTPSGRRAPHTVRAGGGCLIDPGIHLIDLAGSLDGGALSVVGGTAWNGFWDTGIEEDCRFVLIGSRIPTIELDESLS